MGYFDNRKSAVRSLLNKNPEVLFHVVKMFQDAKIQHEGQDDVRVDKVVDNTLKEVHACMTWEVLAALDVMNSLGWIRQTKSADMTSYYRYMWSWQSEVPTHSVEAVLRKLEVDVERKGYDMDELLK